MFESRLVKLLQEENIALRVQLSDRESFILRLQEQHERVSKDLLDRIMSMAQPLALRAKNEAEGIVPMGPRHDQAPPRANLPGYEPNLRPNPGRAAMHRQLGPQAVPRSTPNDLEANSDLERQR